jgi:predicted methyltransferase
MSPDEGFHSGPGFKGGPHGAAWWAPALMLLHLSMLVLHPMASTAQDAAGACGGADACVPAKPTHRAEAIAAIMSHLGLGEGSVVADVGAGGGHDTWSFAEVVGEKGTVYAEEIAENKVKALQKEAKQKGLAQVHAVLGREDDPNLPDSSVDLVFLRYVYHHFARPREMLRGIWRALKPRGYLVVVDQRRGTLRDWVPRQQRAQKHSWIAETTVVREAREEGFAFVECAEDYWHADAPFVLVFRRPENLARPGRDPDPFSPLPVERAQGLFLPVGPPYQHPVFVALGEGRKLIGPILRGSSGQALEIVLEEWATQKDERPPLRPGVSFPSVLTEQGDPHLGPEPVDVVFFLDSYHLLFHGEALLGQIHEKLASGGCIYVLDREAQRPLSRREASHRRKIEPETVKEEMSEAGFFPWFEGPRPADDRFLLVFGKVEPGQVAPEADPFVAGPEIPASPGRWLMQNYWRLRGMNTANGGWIPFSSQGLESPPRPVPCDPPAVGQEAWEIPEKGLVLLFEKRGELYLLVGCRPRNEPASTAERGSGKR